MTIRDADRIRDKLEVSLDGRQVFFLFFGGAVLACLVFVLGVMVGKRLEGRERVARVAATSAAVDPLAALDELGADEKADAPTDDLAFHNALASNDRTRVKPIVSDVAPPVRYTPDAVAVITAAQKAVLAMLKAPEAGAAIASPPPAAKPASPPPAPVAARPAAPPPATTAAAAAAAAAAPPVADDKKGFTLQISSFQERTEADALVTRLTAAGYAPFVVMSDVPEKGIFFRVRLGEYPSRTDALTAKDEFERKNHIIAYVTRR